MRGTPTPTAERGTDAPTTPRPGATFAGSGTWTMSALPSCFVERERTSGKLAAVRAKFPPESERVRAGTVVREDDCTILVGEHDLWIARGNDRLRVPPEARLYRRRGSLVLVAVNGDRAEIRVY